MGRREGSKIIECTSKEEYIQSITDSVVEFAEEVRTVGIEPRGAIAFVEEKENIRCLMVGHPSVINHLRHQVAEQLKLYPRRQVKLPISGMALFFAIGLLAGLVIAP